MKPSLRPFWPLLVVLALGCTTSTAHAKAAAYNVTVIRWADADTVVAKHCHGTYCVEEKIRLRAFDAPEIAHYKSEVDQPGSREALAFVNAKYGKGVVLTVSPNGGLSFGRVVADVSADGKDVACELAANGHGMADDRYKPSIELKDAVAAAKEQKLGIWSYAEPPISPAEWRKQNKSKLIQLRKDK